MCIRHIFIFYKLHVYIIGLHVVPDLKSIEQFLKKTGLHTCTCIYIHVHVPYTVHAYVHVNIHVWYLDVYFVMLNCTV